MLKTEALGADRNLTEHDLTPQLPEGGKGSGLNHFKKLFRNPKTRVIFGVGVAVFAGIASVSALFAGTENPSYFNFNGFNKWERVSGTSGIFPNNENRPVSTYFTYTSTNNINWAYTGWFQPYEGYYLETQRGPGIDIILNGVIVKPNTNTWYTLVAVGDNNPDIFHPKGGEMGRDIADPGNLNKRVAITSNGLVTFTIGPSFNYYGEGRDNNGDYLEVNVINAPQPEKNGRHRLRLDVLGNPVGSWFKAVYYNYLPVIMRSFPGGW